MAEQGTTLFYTTVDKEELWQRYLGSFPEVERDQYNCSNCRKFIKDVGNVVAIKDNKLVSLWDIEVELSDPIFNIVARNLSELVKFHPIDCVYLSDLDRLVDKSLDGDVIREHLFIDIPLWAKVTRDVKESRKSQVRSSKDVFLRGLEELSDVAIEKVVSLMEEGALYRGEEYRGVLEEFYRHKKVFNSLPESERGNYVWLESVRGNLGMVRIRNTAIGTLLVDLSESQLLWDALRKFERGVMAPTNFKRPKGIRTEKEAILARKEVERLGLTSSLGRRYAQMDDISINDILYVDKDSRGQLKGDVFDDIISTLPANGKHKEFKGVEEISIERFVEDVLPKASSVELMVEDAHLKNLVSIIAPIGPESGNLFKWNNRFSWAYRGGVADSLKEKVKAKGGNVTGDLCCRLAWYNYDDLDLHMVEPDGAHVFYNNKRSKAGMLDVDMNAGGSKSRDAVENIFYRDKREMSEGVYELYVNQYLRREDRDIGFDVEIEFNGDIMHFKYDQEVSGKVLVAKFRYTHDGGYKVIKSLGQSSGSKGVWGVTANKFHKVIISMLSPNHWESSGSGMGNKHYMFILDSCKNPESARGFFNEFLHDKFHGHRKVFEELGARMRAEYNENQLSGLGFSSTVRADIICKVSGGVNRLIRIVF
jgi:hypothetical protein